LFKKMFGGSAEAEAKGSRFTPRTPSGPRTIRHSSAWGQTLKALKENGGGTVMDVGPTSPTNINFLTNLSCSVYMPDPLYDANTQDWMTGEPDDEGKPTFDSQRFMAESFSFSGRVFDAVLLWDTLDFLPEPLVQPVVDSLVQVTRPGGKILAFFHQQARNGEAPQHRRYHITDSDAVEFQTGSGYQHLRSQQNRNIERLFQAFSALKFMLASDNIREVVITR
jgi:hypothetical protein